MKRFFRDLLAWVVTSPIEAFALAFVFWQMFR